MQSGKGQDALKKGFSSTQETNKNQKVTSMKLGKGLNFALNAAFWFCNDDFNKNPEGKTSVFCSFPKTLKTFIFILVQIQTVIFCRKRRLLFAFIGYPNLKDILLNAHN